MISTYNERKSAWKSSLLSEHDISWEIDKYGLVMQWERLHKIFWSWHMKLNHPKMMHGEHASLSSFSFNLFMLIECVSPL